MRRSRCMGGITVASEKIKKNKGEEILTFEQNILMYLHDFIHLLAVIMVVFVFLFRIVIVSGSSMYPTLWNGDLLLVSGSLLYQNPEPGDIIVASKDSFGGGEPIIKRVIATEGQTVDIDFDAGIVYVDGVALKEDYTYTPTNVDEGIVFPITIAEGCIFVLGDNRADSLDSRSSSIGENGLINTRYVLGHAIFRLFPFDMIGGL